MNTKQMFKVIGNWGGWQKSEKEKSVAGTVKDCKKVFHLHNKKNPKNIVGLLLGEMVQLSMTEKWHRREKIYLSILVKKQDNEFVSSCS